MKTKIGNKIITENPTDPALFIAEIGINHNGDLNLAKQMIDMAVMNGADFVKFQKKEPDLCVPEHHKNIPRETPWGVLSYVDYKKKIEFHKREFDEIDRYCKEKGIIWFASPWDIPSIEFLENYETPCYKVPSAKLTDKEFLLKLKNTGKPIILAVGMSTEDEVKKAVKLLEGRELIIMHCHSAYPAKDENLNLAYIPKLKEIFPDYIIGYSGHELGVVASLIAVQLGARIVERHITMDRALWGTDQAASLDYSGVRRLVRDMKKIPIWIGDGKKEVTPEEDVVKDKLRNKDTI